MYGQDLNDIRKTFIVRHSAVVLSELRRGARTQAARKAVDGLFRQAKVQWGANAAISRTTL